MYFDLNETDEKESGDSTTNSPSPWSTSEIAPTFITMGSPEALLFD